MYPTKVATEIVFAEYKKENRTYCPIAIDKDESAWKLSTKRSTAKVAKIHLLLKVFRAHMTVISSLCIELACLTEEDYRAAVKICH